MRKGENYKEPDWYKPVPVPPSVIQFKGEDEDEPQVCNWFGCKKHLTHTERLYGKYCVHHQNRKPFDVTKFIQYP